MGIYVHVEISTQIQIVILVPRLNNLGTRPQEWSSLGAVGHFGVDCKSNGVMSTSHDLHTDQAQLSKYTNIWIMQLFAFL